MTDQVFTIGKEANVSADEIKSEKGKARAMDKSEIQALLDATFCKSPSKTIDEMTDEEVIKHGYALEATIRKLRIHLFEISNEKSARRNKSNTKVFDSLDANYKPKPIPPVNQANDVMETLAQKLLDDDDSPFTTIEEAREFVKRGRKQ